MSRSILLTSLVLALAAGGALLLADGSVSPPTYSNQDMTNRSNVVHKYMVGVSTSQVSATYTTSKALKVTNSGPGNARIDPGGGTITSTTGFPLPSGATWSDDWLQSKTLTAIRDGSSDCTLTIQVTY